jgi:dUTP pyrophosphatase
MEHQATITISAIDGTISNGVATVCGRGSTICSCGERHNVHAISVPPRRFPNFLQGDARICCREELVPKYATEESAGCDLYADLQSPVIIPAGSWAMIPTGIRVSLPPGTVGWLCMRSGLAKNHGLYLVNSQGVLDSDYVLEVGLMVGNRGSQDFTVQPMMRIAQLVATPVARLSFQRVDKLDEVSSRQGGFGSTGLHGGQ